MFPGVGAALGSLQFSHRDSISKGTKVSNLHDHFKYFLTIPDVLGSPLVVEKILIVCGYLPRCGNIVLLQILAI